MIHSHTIEVIPTPSLTHPFEKDLVIYRKEYVYPDWSHQDYVDHISFPRTLSDDLLADVYQDCLHSSPHRDLRSTARAAQRHHKIQEESGCVTCGRNHSYKSRRQEQSRWHARNKREKKEKLEVAVQESQNVVPCYTRNFTPVKHSLVEWDTGLPEELDAWVAGMHDDVIRYITLHQDASTFESSAPYTEIGESFATWAQRRINEMRSVREDRLRRGAAPTSYPMVWKRRKYWRVGNTIDVYTGDASTITLPTNTYDAFGHELLRSVLESPLREIHGYAWFGEYEWAWHRNMSGCWEIGYARCTRYDGDWEHDPIPCPHCCADGAGVFLECYCRDFDGVLAPEGMQMCSLVEWVSDGGRKILVAEEASEKLDTPNESETGEGWEVLSGATSESWSVVSVEQ
jgi:hypothetical protein